MVFCPKKGLLQFQSWAGFGEIISLAVVHIETLAFGKDLGGADVFGDGFYPELPGVFDDIFDHFVAPFVVQHRLDEAAVYFEVVGVEGDDPLEVGIARTEIIDGKFDTE